MSDDCGPDPAPDPLWGAGCWVGRGTTPACEARYVFSGPNDGFSAPGGRCRRAVWESLWDNLLPWLVALAIGKRCPPASADPGERCA